MSSTKRDALIFPVAAIVLAGWFGSLVDGVLTQSFTALTYTTPLMLALAGYVFGVQIVRKSNGK
jgi:hypothetical protein